MKMYILYNGCFLYGPVSPAVKVKRITKSENEPDSDTVGETETLRLILLFSRRVKVEKVERPRER